MGTHQQVQGQSIIFRPAEKKLDSFSAPKFRTDVLDSLSREKKYSVVIDLSQVEMVDSMGLGSFLAILKQVNSNQGSLKIACMNDHIYSLFKLVCMQKVFKIYHTVEEALKS